MLSAAVDAAVTVWSAHEELDGVEPVLGLNCPLPLIDVFAETRNEHSSKINTTQWS